MSILQAIYQFLFGPLELFFEVVYGVAFHIVDGNAGAAVIPLSLCLNFLLLPLYNLQASNISTRCSRAMSAT